MAINEVNSSKYTSNIDPLANNVTAFQQKTLAASQFYFAFNFTIGNPQGFLFYDPTTNQEVNYLTLSPDSNSSPKLKRSRLNP